MEPKSRNEKLLSDIYGEMSKFGISEIEIDENTSRNETLLTKIYETLKQINPSGGGGESYSKAEIDAKIQVVRDLIEADYATKTELSDKLDTATASETYATKTDLNSKLDTATASTTYATKAELEDKLDTATASTTYAKKTELEDKLDTATASETYATKAELNTKLDTETASETYATKSDLNSKLDAETASETYATKSDLNSKLDTETASDTYTTKVELTQFKNTLSASVTSMEKRITALEGVTFHRETKNGVQVNSDGMLILGNDMPSNMVLLTARVINPDPENSSLILRNLVPFMLKMENSNVHGVPCGFTVYDATNGKLVTGEVIPRIEYYWIEFN